MIKKNRPVFVGLSIILLGLFHLQPLTAQNKYTFEIGLENLPHQMEGNMIRDEEGFLWFCYFGGIARYDGFEIRYYSSGENTISGPDTQSILVDHDGDLWILTKQNGLNKYSKETDSFTYYKREISNPNSLSSDFSGVTTAQKLFVDNQNRILIGTSSGFNIFNKETNNFILYTNDPNNANSLSDNDVTSIIQDETGIFWIGTSSGDLNRFDEESNSWNTIWLSSRSIKILSLLDDDKYIWIGTETQGLFLYHKENKTVTHFQHDPDDETSLGDNHIYYLYRDSKKNIWLTHKGSSVAGIEMYDRNNKSFIRYSAGSESIPGISSNFISTVYEDPITETFWVINSLDGVIDKYDSLSKKISSHAYEQSNPNSLSSSQALVMIEDQSQRIWISVEDALNIYDKINDTYTHLYYNEIDPTMGPFTTAMEWIDDNDLWLLSNRGILTRFDTKANKAIKHFKHIPEDSRSIGYSNFTGGQLIKDKSDPHILWIALSSGLDRFDSKEESFIHYVHDPLDESSLTTGSVWSVYDDGKGYLWISTFGGLNRLDKATGNIKRYNNNPDDPESIGFDRVSSVFEDSFNNLWVSSFTSGMDLMNRETESFTHYNIENGFPAIGINQTIEEDSTGNLWIGTSDNGILKFNIQSKSVTDVYSTSDGFQDNNFRRSLKALDGEMWFSSEFGLNSFYPNQVNKNLQAPKIVLTSFTQGSTPINLGTAPEKMKEITLSWRNNFFEFQFAVLNYTKSSDNRYAYMLIGRDKEWFYSDIIPSGRYTGLDGGEYTLKLKGSNNDGIWNKEDYSLKITVTPPFWRSRLFFTMIIFIVLIIIALTIIYLKKLQFEIHERKIIENAYKESEEKYRILIDNAPDIRYRTDNDGKIIFISQSCLKLTGYSVEESLGTDAKDGLYYDAKIQELFESKMAKTGSIDSFETELKKKDGTKWWASTSAYYYKDQKGNTLGVEGVTRDITQKKHIELELQKYKNYLSNIIDSMPSILVGVNEKGVVTFWNKNAEEKTGLPSDIAQGKALNEVLIIMDDEMETIRESIRDGQTILKRKKKRIEQNQTIYEDITIYPLITNGVEGAVVRIDNVSDKVRLEELMIQNEKMLSVGGLAAGMAHEINNPLAGMLQTANVMSNRLDPGRKIKANETAAEKAGTNMEAIKKYITMRDIPSMISKMNESGQRVAEIVNNMLSFARQSDNIFSTHHIPILVDKTLELAETDYDLKKQYDFKKIAIVKEYSTELPPIPCEKAKIQQVLLNLFRNGAQAMLDANTLDPTITIRIYAFKGEEKLTIEIEDNGPGISSDNRNKIFEPFFTTKPIGEGTGLGLSVSYFIINEIHKGELFVSPEFQSGSRFVIKLPFNH